MPERLVIVGAGGFGRETLDVVDAINAAAAEPLFDVLGVLDDGPSHENLERLRRRGTAFLGAVDDLADPGSHHYCVAIGSPRVRRSIAAKLDALGARPATLVHPTVTFGFGVEVGAGSVICAGARATTNVVLGRHVHLNPNVTVGHDSSLGDFVSVNPMAAISGDCVIEDGVLIGVAGVILNGLTVGRDALVGGSACVVRDVPAGATVKGVPAR